MPPPTEMVLLHVYRLTDELDDDQDLDLAAIKIRGGFDPTIHLQSLVETADVELCPNENGVECYTITPQGLTRLHETGLLDDEHEHAAPG